MKRIPFLKGDGIQITPVKIPVLLKTAILLDTGPRMQESKLIHLEDFFIILFKVARGGPVVVQAELLTGSDRQVTWIKDGCVIDQTSVNGNYCSFAIFFGKIYF